MSEKHDVALMAILKEHKGLGPELNFLNTVFSFLARKTNVFRAPDIDQRINAFVRNNVKLAKQVRKVQKDGRNKVSNTQPPLENPESSASSPGEKISAPDAMSDEEPEDKTPPPKGNGGETDKYVWTQTLQELQVIIPVPKGTRAKDLTVKIGAQKCLVQLKDEDPIIDAEFHDEVETPDATWILEQEGGKATKTLTLFVPKFRKMNWWSCVVKGDPEIDTKKIVPENSKIDDLDGETQQTVRKMMFDQQQKAMGRPTSEESKKDDMLKKFMAAHPEMDFSHAKMS
eukprot:257467_1